MKRLFAIVLALVMMLPMAAGVAEEATDVLIGEVISESVDPPVESEEISLTAPDLWQIPEETIQDTSVSSTKEKTAVEDTARKSAVSADAKIVKGVPTNVKLGVKESYALKTSKLGKKLSFKSSKPKVASVNAKGVIKAIKKGSATITCYSNKKKVATCKVTVKTGPSKVTLSKKKLEITEGTTYQLKTTIPKNTFTSKYTWTSNKKSVATVSNDGLVTAQKPGTATITVKTGNGKKATCKVTVKKQSKKELKGYIGKKISVAVKELGLEKSGDFESEYDGVTIHTTDYTKYEEDGAEVTVSTENKKTTNYIFTNSKGYTLWDISVGMKISKAKKTAKSNGWTQFYSDNEFTQFTYSTGYVLSANTVDGVITALSICRPESFDVICPERKDADGNYYPETSILSSEYELPSNISKGQKQVVMITSNTSWKVKQKDATVSGWLALSAKKGNSGETNLVLTVKKVPATGDSYSSTLVFTTVSGREYTCTIRLTKEEVFAVELLGYMWTSFDETIGELGLSRYDIDDESFYGSEEESGNTQIWTIDGEHVSNIRTCVPQYTLSGISVGMTRAKAEKLAEAEGWIAEDMSDRDVDVYSDGQSMALYVVLDESDKVISLMADGWQQFDVSRQEWVDSEGNTYAETGILGDTCSFENNSGVGSAMELTVKSNTAWTVEQDYESMEGWLGFSAEEGSAGETGLTISVEKTPAAGETYSSTLLFTTASGSQHTTTITLTMDEEVSRTELLGYMWKDFEDSIQELGLSSYENEDGDIYGSDDEYGNIQIQATDGKHIDSICSYDPQYTLCGVSIGMFRSEVKELLTSNGWTVEDTDTEGLDIYHDGEGIYLYINLNDGRVAGLQFYGIKLFSIVRPEWTDSEGVPHGEENVLGGYSFIESNSGVGTTVELVIDSNAPWKVVQEDETEAGWLGLSANKGSKGRTVLTLTVNKAPDTGLTYYSTLAIATEYGGVFYTYVALSSDPETVTDVEVTEVTLDKSKLSMDVGDSRKLKATVSPSDATDQSLTWKSSDESVATVSVDGTVYALSEGVAEITAVASNGVEATACVVTVEDYYPTKVTLDQTEMSLEIGKTGSLSAIISPAYATKTSVTWSSSNTSVATVDDSGVVTAIAEGNTTITVKTVNDKTATCKVKVIPAPVDIISVTMSDASLKLNIGNNATLVADPYPLGASVSGKASWSSSNEAVATVSSSGKVTAKGEGTAVITASLTSDLGTTRKGTCIVTVMPDQKEVKSVKLDNKSLNLVVGDSAALKATISPSDASDKSVTWSSSATSVAMVDKNGNVKAMGKGTATITVKTSNGKTADCTVKVNLPTLNPPKDVTANAQDSSNIKVTWTKSTSNDVTGYKVFYGTSALSSDAMLFDTYDSSKSSAVITKLNAGTMYYVWVKATSSAGDSGFSNKSFVTTQEKKLPAPTGVKIDATTNEAVSVSFNAVKGAQGYYMYYSTSSTFSISNNKVEADKSKRVGYIDGLLSGKTYYFWIVAYDSNGTVGDVSSRVSTITGSVSLTLKNKNTGEVFENGHIYNFDLKDVLYLDWTADKGSGTIEAKSFVMSRATNFDNSDADYAKEYLYGSASSKDTFTVSSLSQWDGAVPFAFSNFSAGQYVKIWIGARDKNYDTNGYISGIQFALKLNIGGGSAISTEMNWKCWLTPYNKVKAGGMVCVKLKANNVKSFYIQVDGSNGVSHRDVFDRGVLNRLASVCLRVPASFSPGKHTITVVCSDSYEKNDPNAKKETTKLEFTVGDIELNLQWPLNGNYTVGQHYGARDISGELIDASKDHKGVDIGANAGTKIYAAASGTVEYSGENGGYGYYVRIAHANGVKTFYGHMKEASSLKRGDKVNQGDLVGYVGSTGVSSGPHLHFGVIVNGKDVDPLSGYIMPNSVRTINFYTLK